MKLGLKGNEVKIVPYSQKWRHEFIRVKKEIHEHTNLEENYIEHIGSTAIEGMQAKPIIDILVGVDDLKTLDSSVFKGLKEIGFFRLKVDRLGEIIFAKFSDDTHQEKTHFIHLVEYGEDLWKNLIFFRDYLIANEDAQEEYTEVKLYYIEKRSTGINEYTNFKEGYVRSIFRKRSS